LEERAAETLVGIKNMKERNKERKKRNWKIVSFHKKVIMRKKREKCRQK